MSTSRGRTLLVLIAVIGLFAAACSDDSATPAPAPEVVEPEAAEPETALPGEGVTVTMARAN